jgi:hypothetical protein
MSRILPVHELCKENLHRIHNRMGIYRNQHKKKPVIFEVEDLVKLKRTNMKTRRPSKMIDNKLYKLFY